MDLKTLKYYTAVVECGNISAAAERLLISQPPLSQQMTKLESELGVQLFIRGSRSITLTEPGKVLYNRALSLLKFAEQTATEVSSFNFEGKGTINLGCISSCANLLLSFVKNDFSKKYPKTSIKVTEKNTYELTELLSANLLEGAILRAPFSANPTYKKITLLHDQIVAVGIKESFEFNSNEITIGELENYPLIVYRRWENIITEAFKRRNLLPNYYCISDNARTSLEWALSNLGIALVPQSIIHMINKDGIFIKPVKEDSLRTEICFIWNSEKFISAPMKCFIESLLHFDFTTENTSD